MYVGVNKQEKKLVVGDYAEVISICGEEKIVFGKAAIPFPDSREGLNPRIIQTGIIRRPLNENAGRMTLAIELTYMGAAEFEFGAQTSSILRMGYKHGVGELKLSTAPKESTLHLPDSDTYLKLVHYLTDEELAVYIKKLEEYVAGDRRFKEYTSLAKLINGKESWGKDDFWWDLQNDVMFTFDKQFSKRIPDVLDKTITYILDK